MTSPNTAESTPRPEPPLAPPSSPTAAAGTGNRLAWLDVLRGLAALAVVFNHFGYFVPAGLKNPVNHWFNSGDYGVFVFFLISGYIVPASLERKGSVRTFAILLAVCSVTYLLVERPMQNLGRRLGRRLDVRFGPDRLPVRVRVPEPALAYSSRPAE
jgi:peptidoglycan/LPS O-acetylase OafA/YrhL